MTYWYSELYMLSENTGWAIKWNWAQKQQRRAVRERKSDSIAWVAWWLSFVQGHNTQYAAGVLDRLGMGDATWY